MGYSLWRGDSHRDGLLIVNSRRLAGFNELRGGVYEWDVAKSRLHLDIRELEAEGLSGAGAWGLWGVPLTVHHCMYGHQPILRATTHLASQNSTYGLPCMMG